MKYISTIILLLISINIIGQNLADCGIDNNPRLTQTESEFLNVYMNDEQLKGFDFTDKKVIFITGNTGKVIGTKSQYFNYIKKWNERESKIATWVVKLNDKEKENIKSTGYDVIVTYWVKFLTKRRVRLLIDELNASR